MATSGTTTFNPSVDEIIEEAYERTNIRGTRTGYQLKSARRSLNILLSEWGNRGIHLWKIKLASVPLVEGQALYNWTSDTTNFPTENSFNKKNLEVQGIKKTYLLFWEVYSWMKTRSEKIYQI